MILVFHLLTHPGTWKCLCKLQSEFCFLRVQGNGRWILLLILICSLWVGSLFGTKPWDCKFLWGYAIESILEIGYLLLLFYFLGMGKTETSLNFLGLGAWIAAIQGPCLPGGDGTLKMVQKESRKTFPWVNESFSGTSFFFCFTAIKIELQSWNGPEVDS